MNPWVLGPLFGGFFMGLVLRWLVPGFAWKHVATIAVAWAVSFGFVPRLFDLVIWRQDPITYNEYLIGEPLLAWPLGGLITVLVLRWAMPKIGWTGLLIILGGWILAGILARLMFYMSFGSLNTAVPGALGGAVMLWQIRRRLRDT